MRPEQFFRTVMFGRHFAPDFGVRLQESCFFSVLRQFAVSIPRARLHQGRMFAKSITNLVIL